MTDERNPEWEPQEDEERLYGPEVPGPSPTPPERYRCPEHGVFLAYEVEWGPDGKPYCPEADCDRKLEPLGDDE